MRRLVDAQLPKRLKAVLGADGDDAIHTLDLSGNNATPDSEIVRLADSEDRIVVTKDHDFVTSALLHGTPRRLLLISTGNITNNDLIALFEANLDRIRGMFESGIFVELNRHHLILHG